MIKKFLFLFICVALVATIVGCSLHSGHGHGQANADLSTTLSGTVRNDGTLEEITFPSGAKVSAPTADTMQPNVVVTVTESKTSEIGANAIGTPSYIYLYAITAILTSDNNPTENVRVSSLKHPLSISLPTNHLGTSGVCYVGIRFSPDDPWQYCTVSDTGTIALGLRGSAKAIPAKCNISLYRPNIQLALFAYNEESASSTANISVSGMTATSTPIVGIKDEVYQNDLTVKLSLEGANLNGLNASDLTAAVTYRSSRKMPVTVKANGTIVNQTTASDKAVTGANYYTHTFKVPNLAFDTPLGTTADLSFVINTKGMNASDFPKEFLIELNGVSENVIGDSFVCSEYFAFETASMFSIAYDLAGGNLKEGVSNPEAYGEASGTFTLNNPVKSGNTFAGWTGTGIDEGTASMTVTIPQGSIGARTYVASWTSAVLTFTLPGDVTLEMRRCPAGSFVRSGRDCYGVVYGDGNTVTITRDFYMGTYEVTNAQYCAIMRSSSSPSSEAGTDFTGDSQPVVCVSWNDIMASDGFIDKMNRQLASQLPSGYMFALPTEAQWEYACRAETTTDLNSGKDIVNDFALDNNTNEVAWNTYNSKGETHEVGGLVSNSFGLYDMHGNVLEWCADSYGDYSSTDLTDPTGPADGFYRVMRGGSWGSEPSTCSSWFRHYYGPKHRHEYFGFRLALVPGVVGR